MISTAPCRVFLDTNIYIIAAADPDSPEAAILQWMGDRANPSSVQVIISSILLSEISRVATRLRHKDWAGKIINDIWTTLNPELVTIVPAEFLALQASGELPREDIGVYLTARTGQANWFVSANYKLIAALVAQTQEFECFTPEEFVSKHLQRPSS
jgi:predicted nucleic acid-binding protein